MKIAYIGGGSRQWARNLMMDLALCPDLNGEVDLYDIDYGAAQLNETFGNLIQSRPEVVSHWQYHVVPTLEEALTGANFVVVSIQPADLEVMRDEIGIAEKYGLFFPVGDTAGAPGLVRGLRSALIYRNFAHQIANICPDAWVINYTNPMTICTRTFTKVEPQLKVFGCCHEVFGTQHILARVVSEKLGVPLPGRSEIHVNVLGINHFTFVDRAEYEGQDILAMLRDYIHEPGVIRPFTREEVEAKNNWFQDNCQVKFNLFDHLGILPAAGDRHLVEFLPGFTHSPEELFRWGIIRTPVSWRIERYKEALQMTKDLINGAQEANIHRSGEESVQQILAILGHGDLVTNVNLENKGQIPNLPLNAVVETNAVFARDQVRPVTAGKLPDSILGLVERHVRNQEMIVEAAQTGDKDLAFQAVYADPASTLPIDQSWKMFKEMIAASGDFLPGW
jgi:alpha-galactosidase/6-phospho-beta-glucosidase family protein